MTVLKGLKPEKVFTFFEMLCQVPHGSGNTKAVSDLCVSFAKERGLSCTQDEWNNVIIRKPGSKGSEGKPAVILQGHLDMVCAKAPGCLKDMAAEGLDLRTDGESVFAEGTSLGGDDGIAVALIMAILDDESLPHPPIEAVFTSDEEIGLVGASALDMSTLTGKTFINIDSEEEGVFTVGCAGGVRADLRIPVRREPVMDGYLYRVRVSGLLGGHSGCEIDKGRANAGKLLSRLLYEISRELPIRLSALSGGKFDNVIMPEAEAVLAVRKTDRERFLALLSAYDAMFKSELSSCDPGVTVTAGLLSIFEGENEEGLSPEEKDALAAAQADENDALSLRDTANILGTLLLIPQGVRAMSFVLPGLVETSMNLGMIALSEEEFACTCSLRSSVSAKKELMLHELEVLVQRAGGSLSARSSYPAWPGKQDSLRPGCTI